MAEQTKAEFTARIASDFASGQQITAATLRQYLTDENDSRANTTALTTGTIPITSSTGGILEDSAITETATEVVFTKDPSLNPGSVTFRPNLRLSNAGIGIGVEDTATNDMFLSVDVPYTTAGSSSARRVSLGAQTSEVVQSDDSVDLGTNVSIVTTSDVPDQDGALASIYRARFTNAIAGTRFVIRLTDASGPVVFMSQSDAEFNAGVGVTTVATASTDTVFNILQTTNAPFALRDNTTYHVTFESINGTPNLRGNSSGVLYFARTFQPFSYTDLADENNVTTILEAKTGDDRLDANALKNLPTATGGGYNDIVYTNERISEGFFGTIIEFTFPFATFNFSELDVILRQASSSAARTVFVQVVNSATPSTIYFSETITVNSVDTATFPVARTATALPTADTEVVLIAATQAGDNIDFIGFLERGAAK